MKATELRIGNIVGRDLKTFPDNTFSTLEVATENSKFSDSIDVPPVGSKHYYDPEDMEGITLTPYWLELLGLQKLNNGWILDNGSRDDHGNTICGNDTFSLFDHSFGKCEDLKYAGYKITYVHQLQNLYFALTGEEL